MNKSENIEALAGALSKLQGEIKDASKDQKGYGYNYADLSTFLEIGRPLLSKHHLAVSQLCGSSSDKVSLETVLMHESGQWISSNIEMPVEPGKGMSSAQAAGSILTYLRRYAFGAILGMTQTDTDAKLEIEDGEEINNVVNKMKHAENLNVLNIVAEQAKKLPPQQKQIAREVFELKRAELKAHSE